MAFSTAILILFVFLLPISIRFCYLIDHFDCQLNGTIHVSGRTPVEWDGVVGFKQFCTIFLPHIWCLCDHRFTNKAYLSTIMVTNISQSFYLQDGGKNQLAKIWNQNYITVTLCTGLPVVLAPQRGISVSTQNTVEVYETSHYPLNSPPPGRY